MAGDGVQCKTTHQHTSEKSCQEMDEADDTAVSSDLDRDEWKRLKSRERVQQRLSGHRQTPSRVRCHHVYYQQEGQHPLTGQRAADFRLLANQ